MANFMLCIFYQNKNKEEGALGRLPGDGEGCHLGGGSP